MKLAVDEGPLIQAMLLESNSFHACEEEDPGFLCGCDILGTKLEEGRLQGVPDWPLFGPSPARNLPHASDEDTQLGIAT